MPRKKRERKTRLTKWLQLRNYRAYSFAVLASGLICTSDVIFKSLHYMSVSQLAFVRYVGMFTMNLPLLHYRREVVFMRTTFLFLMGRAMFGCLALYLDYVAMKLMPIAEASVITSTTPMWVTLLARIFLKEKLDKWNVLSIVTCTIGLIFMSRVFTLTSGYFEDKYVDMNYWYGCLASLGCALSLSGLYLFLRKLKGVHPTVTIAYQSLTGLVVMTLVEVITRNLTLPQCGIDGVRVVCLATFNFLGQLALTAAFRYEKAGPVSVVHEASYVVFAFFFQVLYFNEVPDLCFVLAAICVILSLVLSAIRTYRKQKCKADVSLETKI